MTYNKPHPGVYIKHTIPPRSYATGHDQLADAFDLLDNRGYSFSRDTDVSAWMSEHGEKLFACPSTPPDSETAYVLCIRDDEIQYGRIRVLVLDRLSFRPGDPERFQNLTHIFFDLVTWYKVPKALICCVSECPFG